MDSDEPYLRPCKQLPSPISDRLPSHSLMGQYLGMNVSSQGQIDQGSSESSQEPNIGREDPEDENYQSDQIYPQDLPERPTGGTSQERLARLLKGKPQHWAAVAKKQGPLRLLDLPLDILKIILKEVTHTNDLASCAKVNSTFHCLVTPMIYSRFDIVWPDTLSSAEPRAGVDALTYGLATLVMREDLFENILYSKDSACGVSCQSYACPHCGATSYLSTDLNGNQRQRKSRRGNYFSQFVKKFSLGNGPSDWVQEYLVTKESGKMLGTLVALSIARMPNLETFIWDMPTGVLRDIWTALSSLGDHRPSRLEKLWIRFHDNQTALHDAGLLPPAAPVQTSQPTPGPTATPSLTPQAMLLDPEHYGVKKVVWIDHHVEQPNFSTMPALRSLTVLDIDEVRYLVELSILLGRSLSTLRELRIGMTANLYIPSSAHNDPEIAPLFSEGVFSLLMSKIYDQSKAMATAKLEPPKPDSHAHEVTSPMIDDSNLVSIPDAGTFGWVNVQPAKVDSSTSPKQDVAQTERPLDVLASQVGRVSLDTIDPALFEPPAPLNHENVPEPESPLNTYPISGQQSSERKGPQNFDCNAATAAFELPCPVERLRLEILEIERLTKLSPSVLSKTIDFTVLASLTLLQCGDQSSLWDRLRREFAPRISRRTLDTIQTPKSCSSQPHLRPKTSYEYLAKDVEYRLRLKRIHTDAVSSDLISFLKTTLAPDSLEWMFLQDTEVFPSPVTLESIYRGPLRRHRASLTKVMIDSAYGSLNRSHNTSRKWMLNRNILTFMTSGRMSRLRELAVAVEYKDWHFFLQRLPNIPHLRSLYVPHMSDHPYGNSLNVKDFALGAIDVVALRPEVELCYLGIKHKCFEILERKPKNKPKDQNPTTADADADSDDDTQDGDDDDDHDDDSDDGAEAASAAPLAMEPGAMDSDTGSVTTEDDEDSQDYAMKNKKTKLKLREILFYDDKISIFKARHGRL